MRVFKDEFKSNSNLVGLNVGKINHKNVLVSTREKISRKLENRIHIINLNTNERRFIKLEEKNEYLNKGFSLLKIKPYWKEMTCLYCNKTMTAGNFTRWHGENCKFKQFPHIH
jgi:hypothetical protein